MIAYTVIIIPYRIAFLPNSDDLIIWIIVDYLSDGIFAVDIIINFFLAYYDYQDELVCSKKKIFFNYLNGWFILDIIGVFPFGQILNTSRYTTLARISKLPRLYKLIRMTKFLRILKIIKERNKILKYLIDILRVGPGFERLFASLLSIFMFCHIASCFWFMMAELIDDPSNWVIRYDFVDKSNFDKYIASFYWITQTVITVGYGDITPGNKFERSISCILMFIGVFFYSFTIGSLSTLLSNLDSKNASFDQKMNTLIQIRNHYKINNLLYNRVKRALKYGHVKTDEEKILFLNELPMHLRVELSVIMYKKIIEGIELFMNKPNILIALIGPFLKFINICKDESIFTEGEYADEMYFVRSGKVALVIKEYNNFIVKTIKKGKYFGEVYILNYFL